jgi:hypothetical protein
MSVREKICHGIAILAFLTLLTGIGLLGRESGWTEVILILAVGALMLLWAFQWNHAQDSRALVITGKNWPGGGEVFPRQDATPEQLKRLGAGLTEWSSRTGKSGGANWIDRAALDDLLAGELPQPFVLRVLTEMKGGKSSSGPQALLAAPARMTTRQLREALHQARETYPELARLLPQADSRTVPFGLARGSRVDRSQIIANLRRYISPDLVEEILIDGRSWEVLE